MAHQHERGNQRLLQLADHLDSDKRGLGSFNFSIVCAIEYRGQVNLSSPCGTCGCAMGEMPVLWPDQFEWSEHGGMGKRYETLPKTVGEACAADLPIQLYVAHKGVEGGVFGYDRVDSYWFYLTEEESDAIFYPMDICDAEELEREMADQDDYGPIRGYTEFPGVFKLGSTATATEVASNIRKFVAYRNRRKNDYVS